MSDDFKQKVTESFVNLSKIFNDLGQKDPYYSVLSDTKYMTKNLTDETISQFYESGRNNVALMVDTINQSGLQIGTGEALDFGCGVGRVTLSLADRFDAVTGCDISESNLAVASKAAEERGVSNVRFVKNEVNLVQQLGGDRFDLIYSVIVLQHMIPPLMRLYIGQFFRLLKTGGIAFFQLPTGGQNYQFNQHKLHESIESQTVQIHALVFRDVFEIIHSEGCRIVDLLEFDCVGPGWNSYIFVVVKP